MSVRYSALFERPETAGLWQTVWALCPNCGTAVHKARHFPVVLEITTTHQDRLIVEAVNMHLGLTGENLRSQI
jgi:hypothetical protein